jgi:hypothetical protein
MEGSSQVTRREGFKRSCKASPSDDPNGFKSIIFLSGFILPKLEDNGPDTKAMGATKLADAMDHSRLKKPCIGRLCLLSMYTGLKVVG